MNHSEIVSFLWGVADLIRDTFKRGKYQDVILPLTVLRRFECLLEPTRRAALDAFQTLTTKPERVQQARLQQITGRRVPEEALKSIRTIADVVDLVHAQLTERAPEAEPVKRPA